MVADSDPEQPDLLAGVREDMAKQAKPSLAKASQAKAKDVADAVAPAMKLKLARAKSVRDRFEAWRDDTSSRIEKLDLAPDLASNIGSGRWFRGFGTMVALGAVALAFWPDFTPLEAMPAVELDEEMQAEFDGQGIAPLALGASSGFATTPASSVTPLEAAPERPQIDLVATLTRGDSMAGTLQRAGVGRGDADRIVQMIESAIPLTDLEPGTQLDIVLGRRPAEGQPRPLDSMSLRARFDLELVVERVGENLALQRNVIRVDDTPLRVRGTVGSSLYRSMRAAGAPANAVQAYIKALDDQIDLNRSVRASDEFDMIVAYRRAATGERQAGQLLYAGIDRDGEPKTQLMRWGKEGRFYEASGVGEQRSGLVAPVPGRITSNYGMRRHPVLGYRRMHAGIDFRARHGTPIVAVTDGRVTSAGRSGGCGITVRLKHAGNLSTRYCHMSRMAVRRGQNVRRGQVIGYVGSTGLSTGPHLHYEMYRGNRHINPRSVKFVTRAQLEGRELMAFRAALRELKTVEAGAAQQDLVQMPSEVEEPAREIEKLADPTEVN